MNDINCCSFSTGFNDFIINRFRFEQVDNKLYFILIFVLLLFIVNSLMYSMINCLLHKYHMKTGTNDEEIHTRFYETYGSSSRSSGTWINFINWYGAMSIEDKKCNVEVLKPTGGFLNGSIIDKTIWKLTIIY